MTVFQLILLGVFGGSLGTTGLFLYLSSREDPTAMILENQSKTIEDLAKIQSTIEQGKIEIQKNLTNTDLLEVSCSATYMEKNGSCCVVKCSVDYKPVKVQLLPKLNVKPFPMWPIPSSL